MFECLLFAVSKNHSGFEILISEANRSPAQPVELRPRESYFVHSLIPEGVAQYATGAFTELFLFFPLGIYLRLAYTVHTTSYLNWKILSSTRRDSFNFQPDSFLGSTGQFIKNSRIDIY